MTTHFSQKQDEEVLHGVTDICSIQYLLDVINSETCL